MAIVHGLSGQLCLTWHMPHGLQVTCASRCRSPQGWAASALGVAPPCWVKERRPSRRVPPLPQHDERPQFWCAPQAPACPGPDTAVLASLARREAMWEALATTTPPKSRRGSAWLASQDTQTTGAGARMIRSRSEPRALPVRERHQETETHGAAQRPRIHAGGCVCSPRGTRSCHAAREARRMGRATATHCAA
jgi:hypothetical protein